MTLGRLAALLLLLVAARASAADAELECPPPQDADARTREARAAEHYARGQELYVQGEFERSIAEFRATYCLVPVPEALHAIGQSYERLVDYERAVAWFERYLTVESPEQKEKIERLRHRVRILRALPARVRVATEPPGAAVVLELEGGGATVRGTASGEALKVRAGAYQLRVTLEGYQPVSERLLLEIGQPYSFSYRLSPRTGTLRIGVEPRQGIIRLDGKLVGIGSYVERLPVGRHEVVVDAPGRPRETRVAQVAADEVATVNIKMRPARPANGKLELTLSGTLFALSLGGIGGAVLFEDPLIIAGAAVTLGSVAFVTTRFVLPSDIPVGVTSLTLGGQIWGSVVGLATASIIRDGASSSGSWMTAGVTAGASFLFASGSYLLARRLELSAGDAAIINTGALWGTVASGLMFDAFGAEEQVSGPMFITGVTLGLLAGGALASQIEFSRGRVALIDLSGFGGLIAGTALATVLEEEPSRYALGGAVVGLLAGGFLSTYFTSDDAVQPTTGAAQGEGGKTVMTIGVKLTW